MLFKNESVNNLITNLHLQQASKQPDDHSNEVWSELFFGRLIFEMQWSHPTIINDWTSNYFKKYQKDS